MNDLVRRLRVPVVSVVLALAATWLLLVVVDAPPLDALWQIWNGSLGRLSKIPDTLIAWVPLTLAAAGLIVTFQAGMWNIGVEGQIVMGAIGAAFVVRELSGPPAVVIVAAFVVGALFGIFWALIPGYLRTRFGVHEIFSGVALVFVASAIAVYLIIGPWSRTGVASTSGTDLFEERYWLPTVGADEYSWLAILVAVAAVVAIAVLMRGTRYGLRLKAVGKNHHSAFLMGIPTNAYMLSAFAMCGALAGIAGTVQALGFHHKLVPSISGNYGFLAILVVLLAGFRALWTAPIALFFAAMLVGSTQLSLRLGIDSSLAGVIQGMLVLFILVVGAWQAQRTRRLARRAETATTAGGG
ncbi:MAG: ABC transporter permease [Acidimicrobiia bacterium]|nr:ABC transporter permease [Acidimicrobiia bacterium]